MTPPQLIKSKENKFDLPPWGWRWSCYGVTSLELYRRIIIVYVTYFLWQEWRSVWLDRFSQRRFGQKYRKNCEFHKLSLLNITMLGFRSFWPILIRLSLWQKGKMYCRLLFNHPSTCKSFKKWNVSKVSSLALLMLLLVYTVFLLVSSCMKITPFWPFWENQKWHSDNRIKILTPLIDTKYPLKT